MRIVTEIALWISGIAAFFFIGHSLGTFAEFFKGMAFGPKIISEPLALGLPLLFVCIRLWVLDRRTAQKSS